MSLGHPWPWKVEALLGSENMSHLSLYEIGRRRFAPAELFGSLANINADLSPSAIGHGGTFKMVVGDDTISAEKKHQDPFTFRPTAKHLYSANQVPEVDVDDRAFFRRWLIVEFPETFTDPGQPGPDKDPDLTDDLLDELPGVLNLALDGLDRLIAQERFTNEGAAEDKRRRWEEWGDTVDRFINEAVETGGDDKHLAGDVYERYTAWCAQHGETPESQQTLTRQLKKLDSVRYSSDFRFDGRKARGFKGLTFTADAPPSTEGGGQRELDDPRAVVEQHVADGYDPGDELTVADVAGELNGELALGAVSHQLTAMKNRGDLLPCEDDETYEVP